MLPLLMGTLLSSEFFCRPTLTVARELLGKFLVREHRGEVRAVMITEVEAYDGPNDKACHAHRGHTPRNDMLFRPGGCFYIYFVYGMHWMLNVVTGAEGYPAAVLIRGAGEWDGPGKLTKALKIGGALNGANIERRSHLWIEDRGVCVPREGIQRTRRIGVDYARGWAQKPYRFVIDSRERYTPPHATRRRQTASSGFSPASPARGALTHRAGSDARDTGA